MIQKTRTIYSTLSDGNMRVFGAENEAEIIKNQMNLGARIGVSDIARIRTTYDDRMDFNGSLYETLNQAGYPITEIIERFTSSMSNDEEEQVLELSEPKVIMRRQRSGFCE